MGKLGENNDEVQKGTIPRKKVATQKKASLINKRELELK